MSLNRPTPPHSPGQEAGIMPMAPGYLPTVQIDDPLKVYPPPTFAVSMGLVNGRLDYRKTPLPPVNAFGRFINWLNSNVFAFVFFAFLRR